MCFVRIAGTHDDQSELPASLSTAKTLAAVAVDTALERKPYCRVVGERSWGLNTSTKYEVFTADIISIIVHRRKLAFDGWVQYLLGVLYTPCFCVVCHQLEGCNNGRKDLGLVVGCKHCKSTALCVPPHR